LESSLRNPRNMQLRQTSFGGYSRWKAAGIHFLCSALIAVAVIAVMLLLWYPAPYFSAMGGVGLVALIAGVDVVLGPLITLVIFNTQKKSLKFDLACVVFVQVAALAYGVHTMFQARPVFNVFNDNRFDVVVAADINAEEHVKVTNAVFKSIPLTGPRMAAMNAIESAESVRILSSGTDPRAFTQHYVDYEARAKFAARASKLISTLQATNPSSAAEIKTFLSSKGIDEGKIGYLPIYTRNKDMTMIVMRDTGAIVGMVPVPPN
jgi:hypothetical protein